MASFYEKEKYKRWTVQAPINNNYPYGYNFKCIETLEELKEVLSKDFNTIAVDTETTGLDIDKVHLVGYSFCYDSKNAYYVPVNHAPYKEEIKTEVTKEEYLLNKMDERYSVDEIRHKFYKTELGEEIDNSLGYMAVKIFYERIKSCKWVFMFNARFDIRVFEKYGFVEHNIPYEERDEKQIYEFDFSNINVLDVQALVFLADTNIAYPNLKGSEEYFLGWRGASFKDTLGDVENFYYLKPSECYVYASTDALGTYLLAEKCFVYYDECRQHNLYPNRMHSGQLDTKFLYPLMIMEDERTLIDVEKLKGYSQYYGREIEKLQDRLYEIRGKAFNILSPKQKSEALKDLGITTIGYDGKPAFNKRGEVKADKESINITIDRLKLDKHDKKREFLEGLVHYANLNKQKGTYVDTFIEMCKNSTIPNRLRFSYKTMVVPSGRLSAGGDKKNTYFANTNIQNVPKPKSCNVYFVAYKDLISKFPELEGCYDNPKEEYTFNGEHTYRILDWVFKESVWNIGVEEKKTEGFKQELNIRSAFCSDDDKYWVSCDFSAQELRVPALLTKEPLWTKTFRNNGDLHEVMAKKIWGEENYDKNKRKMSKSANFGILYGMTARNFANDFNMTLDEAEAMVRDYKKGATTLFNWVRFNEDRTRQTGCTYTMFGRPRRLGWYLQKERSLGMQQYGLRSCTNTVIQGTGADILKMSFLNIFDTFYKSPEVRNINRKYLKFINTVHDEINYNVSKKLIYVLVPQIISCMRFWFPDWEFPMQVGLDIGNRWGETITFEYDTNSHIEKDQEYFNTHKDVKRFRHLTDEEQDKQKRYGVYSYVPDDRGTYIVNSNYLGILKPSGEDLTEKDYIVKEEKVEDEVVEEKEVTEDTEEKIFDNL